MNILFIGDIVGKIGRQTVKKTVPKIIKKHNISLVIANAENAAHGSGITEDIIKELKQAKIDAFTSGDHGLRRVKQHGVFEKYPVLRPANFPPQNPGSDYLILEKEGKKIILINLIGRIFMPMQYDCPFRKIDEILANISLPLSDVFAIIVDIHAEATSEKICLARYLDGRVCAVLGTHTHVQTNDARILPEKTAFITDAGMTGAVDSSLGIDAGSMIKTYLDQVKYPHVIHESGNSQLNGVILRLNSRGKAKEIKTVQENVKI